MLEDLPLFSAMFSVVSLGYGVLLPVAVLLFVSILLIPTLLNHPTKPRESAEAIFSYLMQAVGVLLVTIGALPTLMSVLAGVQFDSATYFTLLAIFAVGGVMFLWYDNRVRELSASARRVPAILFVLLFKIIGHLVVLFYGLSFFITLMAGVPEDPGWWIMPVVMMAYGGLLMWCAKNDEPEPQYSVFKSITMTTNPSPAPKKKPVAKKAPAKRPSAKKAAPKKKKSTSRKKKK